MNRRWLSILGVVALAFGCGPNTLPDPTLMAISPAQMAASDAVTAQLTVEAVLPFHVSLGKSTATADPSITVQIGAITPQPARLDAHGNADVFIPSVLPPGSYDVTVTLADGRSDTLAGGFTVTAGSWPASYAFDTIDPQTSGQPFTITLRAQGPAASTFHGTVALNAVGGSISPSQSGPFVNGVRVETVTVTASTQNTNGDVVLTARDLGGHVGLSNVFKVHP